MVTAPDALTLPAARERRSFGRSALAVTAVVPLMLPLIWSGYRLGLLPDPVLAALSPLEAPWSVRDPLGVYALLLVLAWFALAYRGRRVQWWELPLVLLGSAVVLPRVGNCWLAALALVPPLGMQLARREPRGALALSAACVFAALALLLLNRPAVLPDAAASAVLKVQGGVLADWRWAPALQSRAPDRIVLGGRGLHGEPTTYWLDYLRVVQGHERWDAILRSYDARVLLLDAQQHRLAAEVVRASAEWHVVLDEGGVLVAERR
jgi:hypothetical protein